MKERKSAHHKVNVHDFLYAFVKTWAVAGLEIFSGRTSDSQSKSQEG